MSNPSTPSMRSRPWGCTPIIALLLIMLLYLPHLIHADCECGYSYNINGTSYTFTDLLESDFWHLADIELDTDWRRQEFNVSARAARGPYGESSQVLQVLSNPLLVARNYSGPGVRGGDAGLQLVVKGGVPVDGLVPVAELNSVRQDMIWGSYRAGMKLSGVPGTCAAFFWYFNDSQEIDMEFLSSQFNDEKKSYPVNLVLQSAQSVAQGYNAAGTGNYIVVNLPFNPTTAYHEYRIDFVPGSVVFYADSHVLATLSTNAIPTQPGHLILTHWSNGNPLWSSGPPAQDAILTVSYVKSYFNSTLTSRIQAQQARCTSPASPNAICVIPDQVSNPDQASNSSNGSTFFFSAQENSTNGQIIYHQNQGRKTLIVSPLLFLLLSLSLSLILTTR